MTLIIIIIIIIPTITLFMIYTNKFYNPYKLVLYMGKKGVGKSTILQQEAFKHYKKGWNIYCNIGDTTFKKAHEIDCTKLWEADIKPHSVVLIDEVNLLWDNRDFKKFPQELNRWFRAQRHEKVKVIMFSQTADVDKKIRDLTDRIYLVRRYFQVLIIAYPFEKDIDPPDPKRMQNGNDFVDTYHKKSVGPFFCQYCWLPKWIKMHDSFKEIAITEADRERLRNDMMHRRKLKFKEREEKHDQRNYQHNNVSYTRSDRRGDSVHQVNGTRRQAGRTSNSRT